MQVGAKFFFSSRLGLECLGLVSGEKMLRKFRDRRRGIRLGDHTVWSNNSQ